MKMYLEKRKFYVMNEDKRVYEVQSYQMYDNCDYAIIELQLVAGWDYIDPDNSDVQGWVKADRFVEEVQDDTITWFFTDESMLESLAANDYIKVKGDLDKIIKGLL